MADEETVRRAALALPETTEEAHWERPSVRVGGKIFAVLRPSEGRAVLKLPHDHQEMLFAARPEAFARRAGAGWFGPLSSCPRSMTSRSSRW